MRFEISPAGSRGRAKLLAKCRSAAHDGEHVGVTSHYLTDTQRVAGSIMWRLDDNDVAAVGTSLTDWLATGPPGLTCGRNIIQMHLGGLGVTWVMAITGCREEIIQKAARATSITWNSGAAIPPADLRPWPAQPASRRP